MDLEIKIINKMKSGVLVGHVKDPLVRHSPPPMVRQGENRAINGAC
jgi:hypothetical protein